MCNHTAFNWNMLEDGTAICRGCGATMSREAVAQVAQNEHWPQEEQDKIAGLIAAVARP